jgi:hypothetical protein
VFAVPPALAGEAVATCRLAALGFFLGQLQSYLNSVPQSLMRYDIASRSRWCSAPGAAADGGVLMLGYGLFEVILLRVIASAVNCLVLWRASGACCRQLRWRKPGAGDPRELLGFLGYSFLSPLCGAVVCLCRQADHRRPGRRHRPGLFHGGASTLANRVLSLTYRLSGVFFPAASALARAASWSASTGST